MKHSYAERRKAEEDTISHYMDCLMELLTSTSTYNGQESIAGMIAQALANAVPSVNDLEEPLGPESPRVAQQRLQSLERAKKTQQDLFDLVKVVKCSKG